MRKKSSSNQLSTLFLALASILIALPADSKPVQSTTLEDALKNAPIIVLAESGPQQWDDLKEGVEIKTTTSEFENRAQTFKILKVFRNKSKAKIEVNSVFKINNKSNGCIVFDAKVKREGGDLLVTQLPYNNNPAYSYKVPINHKPVNEVLFLTTESSEQPQHYGWFISPHEFTPELQKQLRFADAPRDNRTVHMAPGCD